MDEEPAPTLDGRQLRSRTAMLAAARSLLQREGPAAVTHQRVAEAAGVGRATVYRHWDNPDRLLRAVMAEQDVPFFLEPRLPLRPWLRAELRRMADELALPVLSAMAVALMNQARWGGEARAVRNRQLQLLDERLERAFALAADAGELRGAPAAGQLSALLIGPLVFRAVLQEQAVPDELITRLVDAAAEWQ